MRRNAVLAITVGLALAAKTVPAANIIGTVTLKGTPPPEVTNTFIMDDDHCGKFYTSPPTTHHYIVGAKGELANAIVSLKDISGKSAGASAAPMVLDQLHCQYVPAILAVQTGQRILVKNSDPVLHNIHAVPKAPGNDEVNMPQMEGQADLTLSFAKPESFLPIKCDVHQWMLAYVSVFDHPYFAVSDKAGAFKIANVPPGKYTIQAAHRKAGAVTKEVEVKDSDVTVDFTIELK